MTKHVPMLIEGDRDKHLDTKVFQTFEDLAHQLRNALQSIANPVLAPGMQRYMKSAMPYLGVPVPSVRRLSKKLFAPVTYLDSSAWQADVLTIWRNATYREERYAATELSSKRFHPQFLRMDSLAMFEEMIVTGAWWDHVDIIASNQIWNLLCNDREAMRSEMLVWSQSDDIWKRRTSIICQLKAKENTDLEMLYACIKPSLASKEFFLRKAIGWSLREYAKTDPKEIKRYVARHAKKLSSLSQREALKWFPSSDASAVGQS